MYDFQTIFGINPADATDLWTWGWGSVVSSWTFGWAIRMAVKLIKEM